MAWINNMAKATEISPIYQQNKISMWVPVCWFACPCLRPTVQAAISFIRGDWFGWPRCVLERVRTPTVVHEWSQGCCGCGMKIGEPRNARNQHFIPYAVCRTIILHLARSVWVKWSRMLLRLKPAYLISSIITFTQGRSWPAWELLQVFEKCCKRTQIPATRKHLC